MARRHAAPCTAAAAELLPQPAAARRAGSGGKLCLALIVSLDFIPLPRRKSEISDSRGSIRTPLPQLVPDVLKLFKCCRMLILHVSIFIPLLHASGQMFIVSKALVFMSEHIFCWEMTTWYRLSVWFHVKNVSIVIVYWRWCIILNELTFLIRSCVPVW